MNIISKSADELVVQEGSTSGMVIGAVLVVAGVVMGMAGRGSSSVTVWIALAAIVAGTLAILFSSSITVSVNKRTGQVVYQKKRLIAGQNTTYAISDILRIETRKQWRAGNTAASENPNGPTPQQVLVAQSVMVFKDGRELPLDRQKNSSNTAIGSVVLTGGLGAEVATASQVADFLSVPYEEIAPPDLGGGMQINVG